MHLHKITDGESDLSAMRKTPKKPDRLITITVLSLLAAVIAVGLMFSGLINSYRDNTARESTAHLTEINQELRLYVETKIDEYWNAAHSIAESIRVVNIDDDALLNFLANQRDIYGMSNITIFTRSGYAVDVNGSVLANDIASETVSNILSSGESLTIKESTVVYTVLVDTDAFFHGSEIVAVSIKQDLGSFLDSMGISSFDGAGFLYLTNNKGAVISKLTRSGSDSVYNLLALLKKSVIKPLSDNAQSTDDLLTSEDCAVFLREADTGEQYVVASPIKTGYDEMRLFYIVPESVVNQTMVSFSVFIITLSVVVLLVFVAGAITIFLYLYNSRKKRFDKDVSIREHMLELLVQSSKSAFALYEIGGRKPRFHSDNGERIIGEEYFNLVKVDGSYRFRGSSGIESDTIKELNSQLAGWDGSVGFQSTFMRNNTTLIPSYFEVQLFPTESSGENETFICIAQDVTSLYERQVITTEALAMAEQANEAKTHFLSNMSHDIRTPMNAIVNMTNFALESIGEPEKQREYLDTIRESSAHLLRLVNDVLDMSRIESGRMTIASEQFNLREVINRVADIVRPLCADKKQSFTVDLSGLISSEVLGDEVKLSQIIMNLLSNAYKYTPKGGSVFFSVKDLPSLHDNVANLRFVVKDSGIGISADNLKKIFEPFSRVENEQVNKIEGTGLGLSICHGYINAMGGTISCESEVGLGSTFTVELFFPVAQTETNTPISPVSAGDTPFAGKRCLICEDNNINLIIASKLLERLGFVIDSAANGKEGSEKFEASPPYYYDVIYMDIQMPVMDGYEATSAIRSCAHPQAKSVPIIAMTANVFAEDVERARSAGMNGHIGKPIFVDELIATTAAIINNGGNANETNP